MNIIRMSGGLGNQMFQYALYLKLRSLGKEVKFDDINEYRSENVRPIMLSVFGIEYPRASWQEIVEFTDGSMDIWKRIRRNIFGRKAIEYCESGFYDPQVLSFDSMYLRGSFQSEKYFADMKEEVRDTYRFPELERMHLPEKLYNSTMGYLEQIAGSEAVGIHMYRSDSRTDEELYEGICTEKYYAGAVKYIQEKYPDATFFIFSNEPKWVKKLVDQLVKSQITEEMTRTQIKEMKKRFVMVETNTEYTGYLDMMLMSKCRHNVISNSSFSWWAAWLNDNKEKIVIAPSRWNNENGSDEVFAKGMILMDAQGEVKRQIY